MTIETDFFRQVMGQFTTGVTVVTTHSKDGLAGLTVNSFTSVSLEPPLVLICIDLYSTALPFIRASGSFAVNILTSEQENLSRCFATTSSERYEHFCYTSYHVASTGSPILEGALAFIDSRIIAEYPGGDHVIFVGHVEAMGTNGHTAFAGEVSQAENTLIELKIGEESHSNNLNHSEPKAPLVYFRGKYRHLARDYQRPSLAAYYEEDAK
ncbi:MAG TPA: flavin reductase family protein [Ktedonobacteraceae bacterium]|nr:flavin reductase family protein [Ktedonobacteraceae bacterium]